MPKKNIRVVMELLGPMRLPPSGKVFRGEFPAGTALGKILAAAGYSDSEMKALQAIRGEKPVGPEEKFSSNVRLKVFLRLGGG